MLLNITSRWPLPPSGSLGETNFTFDLSFDENWCAFATTIGASVLEIIKSFIPAVCQSEEELTKIDGLSIYFGEILQKIEGLWNLYENTKSPDESLLSRELSKVIKKSPEKETLMNKLIHSLSKKEDEKIRKQADDYLIQKFYEQQE